METPPPVPHPTTTLIDYHVGMESSLIRKRITIVPQDPDQLTALVNSPMYNREGQEVEVFDAMGNIYLEGLAEVLGMGLMIRSGELSPKSSINGSDCGETFAFGNDGSY